MPLREIIVREEDRVFAIDSECFIIFTGDSIRDRKPFIRIGNWMDLPAEIIPLVENIIVTDTITGNPSHEQFNIDIKYLRTNRYIGSHTSVERYLNFQKVFGLDLHTASVIDAEDVPEISKMNVSDREAFIGVFYRDGNFKVLHKGKDLFSLADMTDDIPGDNRIHDKLASLAKPRRYAGSGFCIVENNPIFYRANAFASYLFPHTYFTPFYHLGINPKLIETIIHPSENFLGLGRFIKWKHSRGGKCALFSDATNEVMLIKNLFSKAKYSLGQFTGMKHSVSQGFSVQTYPKSFSVIADIDIPSSSQRMRIAFVKGSAEIKHLTKEKFTALFAVCSAYEESAALFRACSTPVAVIDDGSSSVSKIPLMDIPVIRQNFQYEYDVINEDDAFMERMSVYLTEEHIVQILKRDPAEIEKICTDGYSSKLEGDDAVTYFNQLSLLKFMYNGTADRKLAAVLKTHLRSSFASASRAEVYKLAATHRIDILITNGIMYEFACKLQDPAPQEDHLLDDIHLSHLRESPIAEKSERLFYDRVIEDRARLARLLALFMHDPAYRREVKELKEAIERRKNLFVREKASHPAKEKGFISRLITTTADEASSVPTGTYSAKQNNPDEQSSSPRTSRNIKDTSSTDRPSSPLKRKIMIAAGLFIFAALLSFGGYKIHSSYKAEQKAQAEKAAQQKVVAENKRIIETFSVTVSEYDIFQYANETAVKNGYAPIEVNAFAKRNPHWIYPGNVFILPDGEKVVVKDRDTLWNIARDKLEKQYIEFFKIYEELKRSVEKGNAPDSNLMKQARALATKDEHNKLLDKLSAGQTK